jgi:hypothetical protein
MTNAPSTAAFNTTGTDEIVFAGAVNDFSGITYTAGSGYTLDGSAIGTGLAGSEHRSFTSAQTGIVANFTQSGSTDWMVNATAFKAGGGGGGGSAQPVLCIME